MSTEKKKFIELAVTVAGLIVNSVTMATLCSCGKRKLTNRAKHLVSITAANLVAAIGVVLINLNALRRPGYNMFCLTWSDLLVEDVRIAGYILIMLGLCSLSADLYLSVNHSMRYQIHSRRITNATIAGTWTLGLCLGFLSTLANQLLDTNSRPYQARYCDDPFPAVPPGLPTIRTRLVQMNATKREQFAATAGLPAIPPLSPVGASDQPQFAVVAHWLLPTPPLPPVYDKPVMSEAGNRTDLLHLVKYLGFATQSAVTAAGLLAITVCMALIYRRILRPSCGRPPLARRRRGACTILILLLAFLVTTLPSVAGELYMLGALSGSVGGGSIGVERLDVTFILAVQPYLSALAASYTVASPIIFYTRLREVRASYQRLLYGLRHQRSSRAGTAGTAAAAAAAGAGVAAAAAAAAAAAGGTAATDADVTPLSDLRARLLPPTLPRRQGDQQRRRRRSSGDGDDDDDEKSSRNGTDVVTVNRSNSNNNSSNLVDISHVLLAHSEWSESEDSQHLGVDSEDSHHLVADHPSRDPQHGTSAAV